MRHISLAWILMCAFLLPLIVSVYRDSLTYGVTLQDYNFNKGQAIHISGAQPEDTALFHDLDGLTEPYYEDGTIFITYASKKSEKEFQDVNKKLELSNLLKTRTQQSSHALEVTIYDVSQSLLGDAYIQTTLRNIQLINLALLLFSGMIVQAAYRNHINSFSLEIANISALGASKGQIHQMFLSEFILLFPLSSAGAIGISYRVMQLLYRKYLGNTDTSASIWRVFHMDAKSTALQILFYLLVCSVAMGYALWKEPSKLHIRKLRKASSLPQLWVRRTRVPFFPCLAILIPLFTTFLIFFNQYLSIYAETVYSSTQDAKITVETSARTFSQGELNYISSIQGIDYVEPTLDFSIPYILFTPDNNALMVSLHTSDELPVEMPKLKKNQFISDLPESMESENTYLLNRISDTAHQTKLMLVKRIEPGGDEQSLVNVYVSTELIQEFLENGKYTKLIVHTSSGLASAVETQLRQGLSESVDIFNYQNYINTKLLQEQGNLWLLSCIFCILMVVAMQIVWVRLAKYVQDCSSMLRVIQQVGASRNQISRLIPIHYGIVPGTVIPFLIAIPWAWLDALRNDRPFVVSFPVISIYFAIIILAALSFLLPVKCTLRKILDDL